PRAPSSAGEGWATPALGSWEPARPSATVPDAHHVTRPGRAPGPGKGTQTMATTPKSSRARRRVGILAAAALALGAFAAPGAAHAANCPGADVPLNHATIAQRAQASDALICLANDARANAGLSPLTVDQSLSDFAPNKSDTISRGYHNDACGGVAENGFPFSVCVESVEVLVPSPTAQQLFDGILTGNG